jgi:hypothetical protein
MKAFLLSFHFEHPQQEGQQVSSIALVHAETYDEAVEKINNLRTSNGQEPIPTENFANATIE